MQDVRDGPLSAICHIRCPDMLCMTCRLQNPDTPRAGRVERRSSGAAGREEDRTRSPDRSSIFCFEERRKKRVFQRTSPPFFEEPPVLRRNSLSSSKNLSLLSSFFGSEDQRTPHLRSSEAKIGWKISMGPVVGWTSEPSRTRRRHIFRAGHNRLSCSPGIEDNCPEHLFESTNKGIICKPLEKQSPRLPSGC